jgi:hypothetical protein
MVGGVGLMAFRACIADFYLFFFFYFAWLLFGSPQRR